MASHGKRQGVFWPLRRMARWLFDRTLGPIIDAKLYNQRLCEHVVYGDSGRLTLAPTAAVNNALFNTISGTIVVEDWVLFGHNVSVVTGTHEVAALGKDRQAAVPASGRDVVIQTGAWLASNVTVLGPCVIGQHAVVAAGAVVTRDVEPFSIVGGVPARVIGHVPQ